jgi:hypothetical protein
MSDTTSFLGGAALAGLAALIVLRGGINFGMPNVGGQSQLLPVPSSPSFPGLNPAPSLSTNPLPSPVPIAAAANNSEKTYEDAKQRVELDQIKSQLEQQQVQIRSQQSLIDALTAQTKTAAMNAPPPATIPQMVPQQTNADGGLVSGLPWALGGVLLTFGGGIALVGMFSMLAKQNSRPVRTVEYIHDDYPAYLPQRRRVQALPPRRMVRRVDLEDED